MRLIYPGNDPLLERCRDLRRGGIRMEEEVLVVTFVDADSTRSILDKHFDVTPDETVTIRNNYFNISVKLRVLSNPDTGTTLCDGRGEVDISRFPAVVLLSSSQPDIISRCQKVWDSIQDTICKDAIRILFVDGDSLDERQTYEIVAWGLGMHIEVVNSLLCREDNVDIPVRLKRILECSPWPSISHGVSRQKKTIDESKRDVVTRDETPEVSHDDFILSKPTSLRRGLHERDVTKLVDDLVLADSSDNDG